MFLRSKLRNFIYSTCNRYFFKKSLKLLTKMENNYINQKKDLFDIPFKFNGFGYYKIISPSQEIREIKPFYLFLKKVKPKIICEIGTDKGGTLYLWTKVCSNDGLIISLDLDSRLNYSQERREFYSNFKKNDNQRIEFIIDDSHKKTSVEKLKKILNNKKIDFLFIDGDHSFNGVKQDYIMYSPFVKKGGYIAFHDIRTVRDGCGVKEFWDEIRGMYNKDKLREFAVNEFGPQGAGIGLLKNE